MAKPASAEHLKALHDLLINLKPAGETHDCPLCRAIEEDAVGTMTDEEVQAAIAKAVDQAVNDAKAPLEAELATLRQTVGDTEVTKAVADATAPLQAQLTELTTELAEKAVEAKTAKDELEAERATRTAEEATRVAEERKAERLEAVKATEVMDEKDLDRFADTWAAMTDEAWGVELDKFQTIAATKGPATPPATPPLPSTAPPLTAAADAPAAGSASEAFRKVLRASKAGTDVTKLAV